MRLYAKARSAALLLVLGWTVPRADSVKPFYYGPFIQNHVNLIASPTAYKQVLSNGYYHFQLGWIEPIYGGTGGLFHNTYFETDGNISLSPYYTTLSTTFNLKPIRYLEGGITYNRLLFNYSMVTFYDETLPAKDKWDPAGINSFTKEPGGADVFTFQGNLTVDAGPVQLFVLGSRSQWDVDAAGKSFVYDYVDDLLIHPRDRVNYALAQIGIDLSHLSTSKYVSYRGLAVRDQYWYAEGTSLEKNLLSAGISGFRIGRNPRWHRRGLDFSLGYWLKHPQLPSNTGLADHIVILADWNWNIQLLNL